MATLIAVDDDLDLLRLIRIECFPVGIRSK